MGHSTIVQPQHTHAIVQSGLIDVTQQAVPHFHLPIYDSIFSVSIQYTTSAPETVFTFHQACGSLCCHYEPQF